MQISKGGLAKHVNEYIEYCNLVGDNGGVMMSEKEFDDYRRNYAQLAQNRFFTSWYNSEGLNCKTVGPTNKCFCDHAYKAHDFLESANGKLKCKTPSCKCGDFQYLPIYGSQDFKCSCKHSYQLHDPTKRTCKSCPCKQFVSNYSCSCGQKYGQHTTVSEKAKEKEQRGEVVNARNGGIVAFSSILEGADRYEHGIKEEVKKKGMKVVIEDWSLGRNGLEEEVSAWELANKPLSWLK